MANRLLEFPLASLPDFRCHEVWITSGSTGDRVANSYCLLAPFTRYGAQIELVFVIKPVIEPVFDRARTLCRYGHHFP